MKWTTLDFFFRWVMFIGKAHCLITNNENVSTVFTWRVEEQWTVG